MPANARDCEHGSLARSCRECELLAEVERLRDERDDLQAQTEALTHLNANLRDDLETADVGWRAQSDKRQVAEAERDRLRDGIAAHREKVDVVWCCPPDFEVAVRRENSVLWALLDRSDRQEDDCPDDCTRHATCHPDECAQDTDDRPEDADV